jgi:hypothetical protein
MARAHMFVGLFFVFDGIQVPVPAVVEEEGEWSKGKFCD